MASLGTGGSLVAGAALLFVLASALVSFNGWPHVAASPAPVSVRLTGAPRVGPAPALGRLAALSGSGGRAGAAARVRAGRRGGGVAGTRGVCRGGGGLAGGATSC